jgi:hypothetical protein
MQQQAEKQTMISSTLHATSHSTISPLATLLLCVQHLGIDAAASKET